MFAVTPQLAPALEELRSERRLSFPILVDPGNAVAAEFGIRHVLPQDLQELYGSFGLNLPDANGDDSWSLPMPSRYVIDTTGTIRAVAADPDYTMRPEPDELLPILDELKGS